MATSALPAALTALVTALQAADALTGVLVTDGQPVGDTATQDFLAVGWSGGEDQVAEIMQDFNAAGARTRDEDFSITCVVDVWSGDEGFATVRNRVFEIFGVVETVLRATGGNPAAPTLNGTVLWSELTTGDLFQSHSEGAIAGLAFTIACRARI